MIELHCPNCRRTLQMPDDAAKSECQCPSCHAVFGPTGIVAGEPRLANRSAAGESEVDDDLLAEIDLRERDAAILAERRRYFREIEDANPTDFAGERRWNASKKGAMIGFVLGGGGAVLMLAFPGPRDNGGDFISATLGDAIVGALIGLVYMHFRHTPQVGEPAWIPRVALASFALGLISIMLTKADSPFHQEALFGGAGVGVVMMASTWILLLVADRFVRFLRK